MYAKGAYYPDDVMISGCSVDMQSVLSDQFGDAFGFLLGTGLHPDEALAGFEGQVGPELGAFSAWVDTSGIIAPSPREAARVAPRTGL